MLRSYRNTKSSFLTKLDRDIFSCRQGWPNELIFNDIDFLICIPRWWFFNFVFIQERAIWIWKEKPIFQEPKIYSDFLNLDKNHFLVNPIFCLFHSYCIHCFIQTARQRQQLFQKSLKKKSEEVFDWRDVSPFSLFFSDLI